MKMLANFEARHGSGYKTYWTRPKTHVDRPLSLDHYILAFMTFGVCTMLSLVVFATELALRRKNRRKGAKQGRRKRNEKVARAGGGEALKVVNI